MKTMLALLLILASPFVLASPPSPPLTEDDLPLPVDVWSNSARVPVQLYAQASQDGGVVTATEIRDLATGQEFAVPEGKQLVIEHVSMAPFGSLSGDQNVVGVLFVGPNRFFVGRLTAETGQYSFFPGSGETVNIRVPYGERLEIGGPSNVATLVNYSLSGYLEAVE